jgi:hypothetical protein
MRPLPTLGGGDLIPLDDLPNARDLNEFGHIVGTTSTARGASRATLWTPTAGPLAVEPTDGGTEP